MLNHPTLEKLTELRLSGMREALTEQQTMTDIEELDFEERLGFLVDRELTVREDRRLTTRLRNARLRQQAAIEDLDYHHPRGLDKSSVQSSSKTPAAGSTTRTVAVPSRSGLRFAKTAGSSAQDGSRSARDTSEFKRSEMESRV